MKAKTMLLRHIERMCSDKNGQVPIVAQSSYPTKTSEGLLYHQYTDYFQYTNGIATCD